MRAKNEAKFLREAYNTKLLLERVVDGTLMCPEACCGAPVMECKCGPDCPHCNCHEIQKLTKKEEDEEGSSFTLDDVLMSGMEILGDYGAYEANLRGSETVDAGVESLKELVEYYLSKLGLTDTDAEYYKKRHEAYQAIWDENFRLNKELLGHADKDERKEQEILNQRYNAMVLAAMNAPQEDNEVHLKGTGWAAEPPPVDEEVRLGNTWNDRFKRLNP